MKTVISLCLILAAIGAQAQTTNEIPVRGPEQVTAVVDTLSSTETVRGISIATQTATSVIVSTTAGYRFVAVQNLDSTFDLYCAERVSVSSTTTSNSVGIKITANQLVNFSVRAYTDFFCLSASTSAATRAAIFRGR